MLTDGQVKEYEEKYKRITHVKSKSLDWEIVLRAPKRQEYRRFRSQIHNPNTAADAQENLFRACCVYPEKEALDALLDDYPAIPEACGETLKNLLGMAVDDSEKS